MGNFETTARWWNNLYKGVSAREYPPDLEHKEIWQKQILSHFPRDVRLKILDVGTGEGYFSRILAEKGHDVIGIDGDLTALATARMRCEAAGTSPEFLQMDSHHLDFRDNTFDLVVSRNVVWTLYDPAAAMLEWKRVLKPGGLLLYYDANWHLEFYHSETAAWVRDNEKRCREQHGIDMYVCTKDKAFYDTLPLSNVMRPAWDRKTLTELGFKNIQIRKDISSQVYNAWEQCLYEATPLFEICAVKPELDERRKGVKDYWNASVEKDIYSKDLLRKWADIYQNRLPNRKKLKILDIGTGGGIIACALASAGHQVTGIDLSDERIRNTSEKAERMGLDITFQCTDAGELPFKDESFDAVVSRNLVWTLYNPEAIFTQWKRVLKPGGTIFYVDANWYYYLYDPASAALLNPDIYPYSRSDAYRSCEKAARDMPLSREKRPDWDVRALNQIGMEQVSWVDLSEEARTGEERLIYAFAPLFGIRAVKPDRNKDDLCKESR